MEMMMRTGHMITEIYDELARHNEVFREQYHRPDGTFKSECHCFGMLFSVLLRARLGDKEHRQCVHFLIAGHSVHVWCAINERLDPWDIPWEDWENTSNHDSCWRSDGVDSIVSKAYFQLCRDIQSDVPEDEQVAPRDVDVSADLGWLRPFQFVRVILAPDHSDRRYSGRYKIVDVSRNVTHRMVVEEEK